MNDRIRAIRVGAACAAVLVCGATACGADEPADTGLVSLRATPGVPDTVIEFVARNSEPRRGVILANERPEDFVAKICGVNTKAFDRVFYSEVNKDRIERKPTDKNRPVLIPACIKWERETEGHVRRDEKLDDVLLRRVGRPGSAPYACPPNGTIRCGRPLRDLVQQINPGVNLDSLREGQTIKLPFVTYLTTFKVAAAAKLTARQVTQKITELGRDDLPNSPIIKNFVAPPVRMITPLAGDEISDAACVTAAKSAKIPWPYDSSLITTVIKRNIDQTKAAGDDLIPTTVTVIDTGLDASFPDTFLRRNNAVDPSIAFGIGTFRKDQMRPDTAHEPPDLRLHGTQVAEIVAGGSGLRAGYPDLAKLFRLNVVNVMEPGKEDPVRNKVEFHVTTEGVNKGAEWATANAQIGNVSIGSQTSLVGLLNAIARQPNFLLVAAAGNERDDLNKTELYPASYGGNDSVIGTQVVTVAAYDANLARATFSNWGRENVDLMAPGCDISFQNGVPGVHGTSFAAPIVSMTAALLRAFGIQTPRGIKQRLQVSVDYDQNLSDLVLWAGRLNIPKALSLYDDVVEHAGALKFGRWQLAEQDVCPDEPIDFKNIRKVTRVENTPLKVVVFYDHPKGTVLSTRPCEPAGGGFSFTTSDGNSGDIAWTDFSDLVVRHYRGLN